MRLLVTGGRDFADRAKVFATLDMIHRMRFIDVVIHGACGVDFDDEDWTPERMKGADRWAHEWALEHGVEVLARPAQWRRLGPKAGPIRNGEMVALKPGGAVAFSGGKGTESCVACCEAAGVKVMRVE